MNVTSSLQNKVTMVWCHVTEQYLTQSHCRVNDVIMVIMDDVINITIGDQ